MTYTRPEMQFPSPSSQNTEGTTQSIESAKATILNFATNQKTIDDFTLLCKQNSYLFDAKKGEEATEALDAQIRGVKSAGLTLSSIAASQGKSDLAEIAKAGLAVSEIWSSGAQLLKMKTAAAAAGLGAAAPSAAASAMTALEPVSAAALAGYTLFQIIKKKKKNAEGSTIIDALMHNVRLISAKLDMYMEKTEHLFSINFENQRTLLKALHTGFAQLEELIRSNHTFTSVTLNRIEETLSTLGRVIQQHHRDISLDGFRKLINTTDGYLNGSLNEDEKGIQQLHHDLQNYSKLDGDARLTLHTSASWFSENQQEDERHRVTNAVLQEISADTLVSVQGYLANYATEYLKVPLTGPALADTPRTPNGSRMRARIRTELRHLRQLNEADKQLLTAAQSGNLADLINALNNGANEDAKLTAEFNLNHANYTGLTPILIAAHFGHSELVRELLKRHANVNEKNNLGQGLVWLAAYNGNDNVIRLLFTNPTKEINSQLYAINGGFGTPLHATVHRNMIPTAKLLLSLGADSTITNGAKLTPAQFAESVNQPALAQEISTMAKNLAKTMASNVVNPVILLQAVDAQCALRVKFPEYIVDHDHVNSKSTGLSLENQERYVHAVRRTKHLYEKLLENYAAAKNAVATIIQSAFDEHSQIMNHNISQCHPGLAHIAVNICHSPANFANAWADIPPHDMQLTPEECVQGIINSNFWGPPKYPATYHHCVNQSNPTVKSVLAPFVGLQRFGLGQLSGSYEMHINHQSPNTNTPINITVNAATGKSASTPILHIDRLFTQPSNINQPNVLQSYIHRGLGNGQSHETVHYANVNLGELHRLAIEEFKQLFFSHRLSVMKNIFSHGHWSVQLDKALAKMDANLRLINAYMLTAGCSIESIKQINGLLWNSQQVREHIHAYANANADTSTPNHTLVPEFTKAQTTLLEIFSGNGRYQFSDTIYLGDIKSALIRIIKLRELVTSMETLRQHAATTANTTRQNGNESTSTSSTDTGLTLDDLTEIFRHYAEYHPIWRDKRFHDPIPEVTKTTFTYRSLLTRFAAMSTALQRVNTLLSSPNVSIHAVTRDLLQLNTLAKHIHDVMMFVAAPQYSFGKDSFDFLKQDAELLKPTTPTANSSRFFGGGNAPPPAASSTNTPRP